jgi:glutamine amidotransferase
MEVAIIDYGAGNLFSIQCGLHRSNINTKIITNPRNLQLSDAVVIPGVGNFSQASQSLEIFRECINDLIVEGRIILGICLGMQILMEWSEEGSGEGLGLIKGSVRSLPPNVKVPHMGWNTITIKNECPLLNSLQEESYFYFVHSYYASPKEQKSIISTTTYGIDFPSVIAKESLFGVQFHPEKSGESGTQVFRNFRDMLTR